MEGLQDIDHSRPFYNSDDENDTDGMHIKVLVHGLIKVSTSAYLCVLDILCK